MWLQYKDLHPISSHTFNKFQVSIITVQNSERTTQLKVTFHSTPRMSRISSDLSKNEVTFTSSQCKPETGDNLFMVLQIKWNVTYGFQCSLEILYKLPNIIGRILSMFSSIRLRIYSLFQKYKALSATWNTKLKVHNYHKKVTKRFDWVFFYTYFIYLKMWTWHTLGYLLK